VKLLKIVVLHKGRGGVEDGYAVEIVTNIRLCPMPLIRADRGNKTCVEWRDEIHVMWSSDFH